MKTIIAIALVVSLMAYVGFETYSAIKEIRAKRKSAKEVKKNADTNGNN